MYSNESILYREQLLAKVRRGEKLSQDERLWLVTHPVVNKQLGYPYLNRDIIQLEKNQNYRVTVKTEYKSYDHQIFPVISVPAGKGLIETPFELLNKYREKTASKKTKALGLLHDDHFETEFNYTSSLGVMEVCFMCEYWDDSQHLLIQKDSGSGDPRYAMLVQCRSDNLRFYHCKAPTSSDFDSLIFSICWKSTKSQSIHTGSVSKKEQHFT